ncbi:hypothetical protein EJB05_22859, partial [Eragrostis curvula]
MVTLLSLLAWLLLSLVAASLLHLLAHARRGLPPGPLPLPVIGSLHLIGNLPHCSLVRLAEIHGPLLSLRLGAVTTVVVSSSDVARETMPGTLSPGCHTLRKIITSELLSQHRLDELQHLRREKVSDLVDHISNGYYMADGNSLNQIMSFKEMPPVGRSTRLVALGFLAILSIVLVDNSSAEPTYSDVSGSGGGGGAGGGFVSGSGGGSGRGTGSAEMGQDGPFSHAVASGGGGGSGGGQYGGYGFGGGAGSSEGSTHKSAETYGGHSEAGGTGGGGGGGKAAGTDGSGGYGAGSGSGSGSSEGISYQQSSTGASASSNGGGEGWSQNGGTGGGKGGGSGYGDVNR